MSLCLRDQVAELICIKKIFVKLWWLVICLNIYLFIQLGNCSGVFVVWNKCPLNLLWVFYEKYLKGSSWPLLGGMIGYCTKVFIFKHMCTMNYIAYFTHHENKEIDIGHQFKFHYGVHCNNNIGNCTCLTWR